MRRPRTIIIALLIAAAWPSTAGSQQPRCITDWSEAAAIIKREQLVDVDRLADQARGKLAGEVVKATLCIEGGRHIYKLVVREAGGQLRAVSVDARKPFER